MIDSLSDVFTAFSYLLSTSYFCFITSSVIAISVVIISTVFSNGFVFQSAWSLPRISKEQLDPDLLERIYQESTFVQERQKRLTRRQYILMYLTILAIFLQINGIIINFSADIGLQ